MLLQKIWGGRDKHYEFHIRLYDAISCRTFTLGITLSWFASYKQLEVGLLFWLIHVGYRTHWASQYDQGI